MLNPSKKLFAIYYTAYLYYINVHKLNEFFQSLNGRQVSDSSDDFLPIHVLNYKWSTLYFLAKHMSSGSDDELRNDVKLDKHLEGHEETINKNINTVEVR